MFKDAMKKFSIIDFKLVKWSAFFFGLFIATFIPWDFLIRWRWIWLILVIVLAIKPIIKAFSK